MKKEKKNKILGKVIAHNNAKGEIHKGSPENCSICKYNADKYFKAHIQCKIVCGDGSGNKIIKHVQNCPVLYL